MGITVERKIDMSESTKTNVPEKNEKLDRLNQIYSHALSAKGDSAFLHDCLYDKDYLVRSKAFYVAEGYCDEVVWQGIYDILRNEEREWQLRALSVICRQRSLSALPYLKECLFQREKPLLIRGAFLALAEIGGEASLALAAEFLASPFSGYLKTELLAHSLAVVLSRTENGAEQWARLIAADETLRRFSLQLQAKADENDLLMVYPYPDYLPRMAELQGISGKEWKQAAYFPRRKRSREIDSGKGTIG